MKHTKEYAEKMAKNIYPDGSYWIGSAETARLYDPNLADRTKFIEGYMKAIEETNVAGLLEALKEIIKSCNPSDVTPNKKARGVDLGEFYVGGCGIPSDKAIHMAINAIKKAE